MTATQPFVTNFDEAWQQFTARATTEDESAHEVDQQARNAKSSYVAFLIPVTGTAVVNATRPVREALAAAGVNEVLPSHYLHITVLGIGLETVLRKTNGSIARLMDRTSRALRDVQPLRLTVRGINSFPNAAFAEVHDEGGGLVALHDRLVETLHGVGLPGFGPSAMSTQAGPASGEAEQDRADHVNMPPYLPHLSLCYYDRAYPTAQIVPVLEPFREMEIGTLRVNYVTLAAVPFSDYDRFPPITRIADLLIG
jgi:2'-5' RNA ligase